MPLVVIVTGPPASGKTTIAARLAAAFGLPLFAKDGVKERLFDELGTGDIAWSHKLGGAAFAVVWYALESELAASRSAVIEGNFDGAYGAATIERLRGRFDFGVLQVHCSAPVELLYDRYRSRAGTRHPGHVDAERLADIRPRLEPEQYRLPLPDELVSVDTSAFGEEDYAALEAAVRRRLGV